MNLRCLFGYHDMVLLDRIVEEKTDDYERERIRHACTRCCRATFEYHYALYGEWESGAGPPKYDPETTAKVKQLKINGYWPRKDKA